MRNLELSELQKANPAEWQHITEERLNEAQVGVGVLNKELENLERTLEQEVELRKVAEEQKKVAEKEKKVAEAERKLVEGEKKAVEVELEKMKQKLAERDAELEKLKGGGK